MLLTTPTEEHLSRMYHELAQHGADSEGVKYEWPYNPQTLEELFCLAADMSRYDPRLLSILVRFLLNNWKKINPTLIRQNYASMKTPETVAVIAEFLKNKEDTDRDLPYFIKYLQSRLSPVPTQFYFFHLYPVAGFLAEQAADMPLAEYKRWGFLAREAPVINETGKQTVGTLDASTRKNILRELFEKKKQVKLSEYLEILNHRISRQQALLDIASFKNVRRVGHGPGARWKMAS